MAFYPTQSDINLLFQPHKQIKSKVEILNSNYMVIDSIECNLLSDSYNVDSESSFRRSYNCQLSITDDSYGFDSDKKIWYDKYIRPYVGIYSLREKEIKWYCKGTYATANATQKFDSSTNTLSLSCNDLMCILNGDIDGVQTALNFTIPMGEDIRTSIIGIIKVFGFTKYRIEDLKRTVQYDLEFSDGTTAYDMIVALMEFCPNYEFFFDLDGTFVVQRIPCYTNDLDVLDESVFQQLLVSQDSYNVNFNTKNCVEIWGKCWDEDTIDRMSISCTYSNNVYNVNFDELDKVVEYLTFAVTIPTNNQAGFKMNINNLGTYSVVDDYGRNIKENVLAKDNTYVFMFQNNQILYLGQFQIHSIYKNETDSKFGIKNIGRELWAVYSDGEYENITSDTLAKERAMYECFYRANLNDSLSITLVDIPWLDVNKKISYTLQGTQESVRWMIKSISSETLSGQCNISLVRFYPDWSEIFKQEYI